MFQDCLSFPGDITSARRVSKMHGENVILFSASVVYSKSDNDTKFMEEAKILRQKFRVTAM